MSDTKELEEILYVKHGLIAVKASAVYTPKGFTWKDCLEQAEAEVERITKLFMVSEDTKYLYQIEKEKAEADLAGKTQDYNELKNRYNDAAEVIEKERAQNKRLREAIKKARNHTTDTCGSFTQWHKDIMDILWQALEEVSDGRKLESCSNANRHGGVNWSGCTHRGSEGVER